MPTVVVLGGEGGDCFLSSAVTEAISVAVCE